jgi:hypothetical protein
MMRENFSPELTIPLLILDIIKFFTSIVQQQTDGLGKLKQKKNSDIMQIKISSICSEL